MGSSLAEEILLENEGTFLLLDLLEVNLNTLLKHTPV